MRAPTALRQARPSGIDRLPPLTARLRRPLLLSATAVVGTLVVLGGWAAVIVGFFALVLVLERALPDDDTPMLRAELGFQRLARERRRAALRGRLRGRPPDERRLVFLCEDEGWVATAERRHLGLQAITVDSIIGTVEHQKAAAFECRFRPPRWSRERWTAIRPPRLGRVRPGRHHHRSRRRRTTAERYHVSYGDGVPFHRSR